MFYTLDGSTPTAADGLLYGDTPFSLTDASVVKVFATLARYTDSAVASAEFTVDGVVGAPVISPPDGSTISELTPISITAIPSTASIFYTTDGITTPDETGTPYKGPFTMPDGDTEVQAIAIAPGLTDSDVSIVDYTVSVAPTVATPSITPPSGTIADSQLITMFVRYARRGHLLLDERYNTDSPDGNQEQYVNPFTLPASASTIVTAAGTLVGDHDSAPAVQTYTVTLTVAAPVILRRPAASHASTLITITSATPGAVIHLRD